MNISVKGEYALHAIFDLALQKSGEPIKIADIAKRQKIPQKFLELILAGLKQGGFVESRRGAEGGYLLARPPEAITVGEVMRYVEGAKSTKPARKQSAADPFAETWQQSGPSRFRRDRSNHVRRTGPELARAAVQVRTKLGDLMFYQDNSLSIGRTPLVKLNRIGQGTQATILAKIEGRNPAYSVKDRIGASMIWDAEKRGVLGPGKELIEPTSGNTGIALAFVAAARGYPITLIMPETMSVERRKVLRAFGANLILTEGSAGMQGSIGKAEELVASDPESLRAAAAIPKPRQPGDPFQNHRPGNLGRHRGQRSMSWSAALEPAEPLPACRVTSTVQKKKKVISIAVEPTGSPVITQTLQGPAAAPGTAQDSRDRRGLHPGQLWILSVVDRVEQVTNEESMEMARRLAREEGILSGFPAARRSRPRCGWRRSPK